MGGRPSERVTKEAIRSDIRRRRMALERQWIVEQSAVIQEKILGMAEYGAAEVVCAYLATPCEVQTDRILESIWAAGRRVCVPAFAGEVRRYQPA